MSLQRKRVSFAVFLLSALCLPFSSYAQTAKVERTAAISGRVMIDGQPAAGVLVVLRTGQRQDVRDEPLAKTSTDAEGRFQLLKLAAGSYRVNFLAPGYIRADEENPYRTEQTVNLEANEAIDNIDFALKRGGVITGQITDARQQPVIEARVTVEPVGERGQYVAGIPYDGETDDRGVYRVFGLRAGRYRVWVRAYLRSANSGAATVTYYPNAKEETKAELVDVPEGGEVENIDIRIGERPKGYNLLARIRDAATGKPIAGVPLTLGAMKPNDTEIISYSTTGIVSDSKGEFRLGGVQAGRYNILVASHTNLPVYSEPVYVEVTDTDVEVDIKTRNGASINGSIIIEGITDAKVLQQPFPYFLYVRNIPQTSMPSPSVQLTPADKTFHLSGLRPGNYALDLAMMDYGNFSLSRIEKDGVEINSFEVKEGEQVADVHIILSYNKGIIRGQVKVESGEFPDLSGLTVSAVRKGSIMGRGNRRSNIDIRGRFVLEGLAPGEYELTLTAASRKGFDALARVQKFNKQTITVTNDAESPVTFVLQTRD